MNLRQQPARAKSPTQVQYDSFCPKSLLNLVPEYADLTPAQLHELNDVRSVYVYAVRTNATLQALMKDAVPERPLIDRVVNIAQLREEYELGSALFTTQIDGLVKRGFNGVRRTRGDGDCFYRSWAFAYIQRLLHSPYGEMAVVTALSHLETTLPLLESAGFQPMVFEDFYEVFVSIIRQIIQPEPGGTILTSKLLLEAFQSPEGMSFREHFWCSVSC
jgi:ubiquitin thioesterase protein OTUB1